jgi:hypothetical protein
MLMKEGCEVYKSPKGHIFCGKSQAEKILEYYISRQREPILGGQTFIITCGKYEDTWVWGEKSDVGAFRGYVSSCFVT